MEIRRPREFETALKISCLSQVCYGDRIIVDVVNKLSGESTTIHWHGMEQKKTPHMDGVPMITQCPIEEFTTFRYDFIASTAGTLYWHSHNGKSISSCVKYTPGAVMTQLF